MSKIRRCSKPLSLRMWLACPKARLSFKGTGYFVLKTGNKTTLATDVAQREGLGFNLLWATVVPALYIYTVFLLLKKLVPVSGQGCTLLYDLVSTLCCRHCSCIRLQFWFQHTPLALRRISHDFTFRQIFFFTENNPSCTLNVDAPKDVFLIRLQVNNPF